MCVHGLQHVCIVVTSVIYELAPVVVYDTWQLCNNSNLQMTLVGLRDIGLPASI